MGGGEVFRTRYHRCLAIGSVEDTFKVDIGYSLS